jgi:hydroxymethylglutaryl-CoA lyase
MAGDSDIDVLVTKWVPGRPKRIQSIMPPAAKTAWIAAAAAAGVREIEVCSFVPAKVLPQMADAAEVVAFARTIPGLTVLALVPNFKGAENAIAAGAHKIALPLSASETHSKANLRKTHAEVLDDVRRIVGLLRSLPEDRRPGFEGNISTAFGCTLEGAVAESKVVELAVALKAAGCNDIGLSDTTGYANPAQLRRLIKLVRKEVGNDTLSSIHLHNTRGLGLANALAALEEGITTLDSSLGGLGGCPYAPGASGNIVTEDLVFMLDAMGLRTGIDLEKLLKVRSILAEALPADELYGFTPEAGLPKGYHAGGWGVGQRAA